MEFVAELDSSQTDEHILALAFVVDNGLEETRSNVFIEVIIGQTVNEWLEALIKAIVMAYTYMGMVILSTIKVAINYYMHLYYSVEDLQVFIKPWAGPFKEFDSVAPKDCFDCYPLFALEVQVPLANFH